MPQIPPVHSDPSDGFNSIAAGFHAVFHFFTECHYLHQILPGNLRLGTGTDRHGNDRIRCSRCRAML